MASLPESSTFDAGVYQLELTDPVIGGPSGVSNAPLKNLANRTKYLKDHVDALESSRAPLASPALTGTPTAPTAANGTNTTQLATTAFVQAAVPDVSALAPKASPALTGTPTAPTAAQGNSTTQLATTAFVNAEIAADAAPISHVGATGSAHGAATAVAAGFMSAADKAKLDGIAAGAQQNAVTSVAGRTGAVTLAVADVSGAAPLDSPALSGVPTAPNPANGVRSAQVATMQKFADEFAASLSGSGWQKLPSGLILQWGKVAESTANSDANSGSVIYPIAFPNAVLNVALGGTTGNDNPDGVFFINTYGAAPSKTGFAWRWGSGLTSPSTLGAYWLAIGY